MKITEYEKSLIDFILLGEKIRRDLARPDACVWLVDRNQAQAIVAALSELHQLIERERSRRRLEQVTLREKVNYTLAERARRARRGKN